jgi:ABC-type uncharacterized transport system fused permease/ATPase subunit
MRDDDIDPTNAGSTRPGDDVNPVHDQAPTPDVADIDPPPDIPKPEENMTPEEVEAARKAYLLKRFWISARGYWTRRGDTLAWPLSIGLLALIGLNVGFQYGINVWKMLIGELPKATILSVGHRVELEEFHSRKITLEKRDGGARLVSDVDLIPRKKKRNVLSRLVRHRR